MIDWTTIFTTSSLKGGGYESLPHIILVYSLHLWIRHTHTQQRRIQFVQAYKQKLQEVLIF